jgi:hypothetical protein
MHRFPLQGRTRLLALAVLLAAALHALPPATDRGQAAAPALLFLSPNTDDGLSLEESVRRLRSPEHADSRKLAGRILRELAVGPARVHDALGDWEGGVENSLLVVLPHAPDAATLRCAAAWFGLAADQKSVLAFRPDPRGADVLVTLTVPGALADVRPLLDARGIRDRTILVDPDGCRVFVLDGGGRRFETLAELARAMSCRLTRQRGHGESLAGATREEARKRYREVLRGSRLASAASAGR